MATGFKSLQIQRINALAELERCGVKYEPIGDDEVRCACPVHDDNTPSVTFNTKKNVWKCWSASCDAKGDVVSFLAYVLKVERTTALVDLGKRYDLSNVKAINSESVERFHARLFDSGPLVQALRERGYKDDWLRRSRIGYHDGRITIPVKDRSGRVLDVLRYLPGAPGDKKMRHTRGFSTMRLYRTWDTDKPEVWICGGPVKADIVGYIFEEAGKKIGAVSSTGGEGSWNPEWNDQFKGKKVYVCMDTDAAGVAAANRVADMVAPYGESVQIIALPLDPEQFPKGDVNDYVGKLNAGASELHQCMTSALAYEPPKLGGFTEKGRKDTTLAAVADPTNIGWRLGVECITTAMDDTPYLVPKVVNVWCTRDEPYCHKCPIKREDPDERGFVEMQLAPTSQAILSLVSSATRGQVMALKEGFGVPPRCKVVEFDVSDHYKVSDVRLSPQLTLSGEGSGNTMQPALVIGEDLDLNVPYEMHGRVYPHPATQRATMVIDEVSETIDSLSTFKPDDTELSTLQVFQPDGWSVEAIEQKLADVYDDLAANVTRIYDRQDLHFAYDLAYHSPLFLNLNGQKINGWVNMLVIGDSAQGKSETFLRMQEHYGLGERVECKNATVAGLLGGLQQLGTRWFVSWGVIPTHDRRLVALEEVKGASIEVLGKLTDMRSSGIAEIPKIERRRAHSRTRLIFISNARSNRTMSSYSFGVEAMYELIGSPEDLRRFDTAIVVAAGSVTVESLHKRREIEHEHTAELCRRLILWSWTREREQTVFLDETLDVIREVSTELCAAYSETLPLIDRGTIGHKLARLSAACAARTFSVDADPSTIVVRGAHVRVMAAFLQRSYTDPNVGYDQFSEAQRSIDNVRDVKMVVRQLKNTAHPVAFVEGLLYRDDITQADIMDWTAADRDQSAFILSTLVRNHALRRMRRNTYGKTPRFIELLRNLLSAGKLEEDNDNEEM